MNAKVSLLSALLLAPTVAIAQGFAGLGQTADGYALPNPATRFTFPEDHGAHPNFRIEWWYLTANLTGDDGEIYGIQWTLFRNAATPGGAPEDQVWMGHAAVSAPDGHRSAERLARGGIGQAGVTATPFEAFIDEWQISGSTLTDVSVAAQGTDFAYTLDFSTGKPFVPQGINGYSVKSEEGLASHYYSQPFYTVSGSISFSDREVDVTGLGWLDREWSSQPLTADQTGWDWTSLHLETGEKLMAYRLREASGGAYTVGTWIEPDGTPTPLAPGDLTMTEARHAELDGVSTPVAWDIAYPAQNLSVRIDAVYDDSRMGTTVDYWEGPVRVTGSHPGRGYLEMTGY